MVPRPNKGSPSANYESNREPVLRFHSHNRSDLYIITRYMAVVRFLKKLAIKKQATPLEPQVISLANATALVLGHTYKPEFVVKLVLLRTSGAPSWNRA